MPKHDEPNPPKPSIDFGYPTPAHGKIPVFNNIEDEAEFWDTHDVTDLMDQLEPVNARFVRRLTGPLSVRLDSGDRAALTMIAKEQGIGPSTLVRMWVKERLTQERKAS